MASMSVLMAIIVLLIAIISYMKILYQWYRKVRIMTVPQVRTKNKHLHHMSTITSPLKSKKTGKGIMKEYSQAPGPMPWPILGNLALLGKHENPFQAFTELSKKYGDGYSLTLGTTRCFIVNSLELIQEVLSQNGKFFGGRPDFLRFHQLFGGDRNHSLALCDWSSLQQKRRNLARKHCSPRDTSDYYTKMSEVGCLEMQEFMNELKNKAEPGKDFYLKPLLQATCANMFCHYMCSIRFDYKDDDFMGIVKCFDDIFWDVNQGYAVDFMPWLSPFYARQLNRISSWSTEIRKFILERIINDREQNLNVDEDEKDFTDALLKSLIEDPTVTRDTIIYMLEDFIGGHSAIGNLVMISLGHVAKNPEIGRQIQLEVDRVTENGKRTVTLFDKENLPYTVALMFEVLRYSSSPIVPHVATEDVVVADYGITKNTIVFINNYKLNMSEKYWDKPEIFDPARFLEEIPASAMKQPERTASESSDDSGIERENDYPRKEMKKLIQQYSYNYNQDQKLYCLKKNLPHFLPFSIGKRTCIGQNLVRSFGFIMIANILQSYNVTCRDPSLIKNYPACVALPPDTFPVALTPRNSPKF